jgi:hypothetical protein
LYNTIIHRVITSSNQLPRRCETRDTISNKI